MQYCYLFKELRWESEDSENYGKLKVEVSQVFKYFNSAYPYGERLIPKICKIDNIINFFCQIEWFFSPIEWHMNKNNKTVNIL